jgi:putative ABC transport system ATP-binding protein
MTSVLELSAVTCTFDDGDGVVTALEEVSLSVDRGEMVAVVGPSGSGKSTLTHVSCGLVAATSGRVSVSGKSPPGLRAGRWWAGARREAIGVVHQRLNLVPALTAIENVALPLRLQGEAKRRALAAAEEALAEVDASHLADTGIDRLSTGQQQRVALARATVGGRVLVLADEPTAALDTAGAEQIVGLLARLTEAGRAALMVTHDSRLAAWADRVVVLRDGRVVDEVSPAEPTEVAR